MKKALIIFALIALTVSAFAATGDKLEITANIKAVKPEFIMKGSFDTAYGTKATSGGASLTTTDDISEKDITVNVKVYQNNKAKYKNTFNLTVTATELSASGVSDKSLVKCTACTSTYTDTDNRLVVTASGVSSTATASSVATFAMDYKDGRPVNPNETDMEIGTATFVWTKNTDMPAGTYNASITLGYTAP